MNEYHEQARTLLAAIWRGIPADYKSRYRRNIWEQFENNVRSAAYTSSLGKFVNTLGEKMQAQIGKTNDERSQAEKVLNCGKDNALLRIMRDETALIVLMVRVANQERQEAWEESQMERREDEMMEQDPLFGLPEEETVNAD